MLDEAAHRRAKQRASELGMSLAEYVRHAVDHELGEAQPSPDVSGLFNLFSSGGSNVAKYKDEYIGEAIEADHERSVGRP